MNIKNVVFTILSMIVLYFLQLFVSIDIFIGISVTLLYLVIYTNLYELKNTISPYSFLTIEIFLLYIYAVNLQDVIYLYLPYIVYPFIISLFAMDFVTYKSYEKNKLNYTTAAITSILISYLILEYFVLAYREVIPTGVIILFVTILAFILSKVKNLKNNVNFSYMQKSINIFFFIYLLKVLSIFIQKVAQGGVLGKYAGYFEIYTLIFLVILFFIKSRKSIIKSDIILKYISSSIYIAFILFFVYSITQFVSGKLEVGYHSYNLVNAYYLYSIGLGVILFFVRYYLSVVRKEE